MKPKVIYIVRHGESEGNINEEIYKTVPDYTVGLTERGIEQAKQAGRDIFADINKRYIQNEIFTRLGRPNLRVIIYSSPWTRARQTTKGILIGLMDTQIDIFRSYPRLREQEWGNYKEDELEKKITRERKEFGTFFYRMPHGESGADVYDRVTTFIDSMYRDFEKHSPDVVIIVTHGLTLKAFLTRWYHWSHEQFDNYKNPENCEIFKMGLDGSIQNESAKYILETPMKERK